MNIEVEEVSLLGAWIVAQLLRQKQKCVLGLVTGRTPPRLYRELIRSREKEKVTSTAVSRNSHASPERIGAD